MVICIIAMAVFAFLGIFSAKYRPLAKESFKCIFRMVTLRPCEAGFERRMKMKVVTRLSKYSPSFGGAVYKHFNVFSWALVILMFASFYVMANGIYNLIVLGTCDPITGQCLFNPGYIPGKDNPLNLTSNFVEFYGSACDYSLKMVSIVDKVENETGIRFEHLEVWYNSTNTATYFKYIDPSRDCGQNTAESANGNLVTPVFYSTKTDKVLCGEVSKTTLRNFIQENA